MKNAFRKRFTFVMSLFLTITMFFGVDTYSLNSKAADKTIPSISYSVHVQGYGDLPAVADGAVAGTTGEAKRMEAIHISLGAGVSGGITYSTHVQDYGWMAPVSDGELSGTAGQAKRLEAIRISLTGDIAAKYDVCYRVHAQDYGWMGWCYNGATAGTIGESKRIEAIQIKLVEKTTPSISVKYTVHQEGYGWLNSVSNGTVGGVTGESKRMEAIQIALTGKPDGGITYQGHVQGYGWMSAVSNGATCGTTNQARRLEAIKINLTGAIANSYDIYYRVHVQNLGWLDWASNGNPAGTAGLSYRIEAIQIRLVDKGAAAPGETAKPYVDYSDISSIPGNYSIRVNKQMNCVTIYKGGVAVKAMVCSTGNATPLGTFYIGAKHRWQLMIHDVYAQYTSCITGDILFHSVWYYQMNNRTLSVTEYNKLGTTASAGCVRLTCADAKWIYDNIPAGTPVTIYNSSDPGPLGKPTAQKLPANQTWDPTDPNL